MTTLQERLKRALGNQQFLICVSALLFAVLLIVSFVYSVGGPFWTCCKDLWIALVPNLIAGVLTFLLVVIFVRRGIKLNFENNAHEIASAVDEMLTKREESRLHPAIVGFYDSFRHINWQKRLSTVQSSLDVIVYYWDSWAAHNREELVSLFRRPKTKVRIFLPNPNNPILMAEVNRLYPDTDEKNLRRKIIETARIVWSAAREAGRPYDSLEVFFVPFQLNYALQRLDGRHVILSVFDMFRQNRVDSPAFEVDSGQSEALRNYWHKELDGLEKASTRVNLSDLDKMLSGVDQK